MWTKEKVQKKIEEDMIRERKLFQEAFVKEVLERERAKLRKQIIENRKSSKEQLIEK